MKAKYRNCIAISYMESSNEIKDCKNKPKQTNKTKTHSLLDVSLYNADVICL